MQRGTPPEMRQCVPMFQTEVWERSQKVMVIRVRSQGERARV
jgi:hypothetical protein